MVNSFEMNRYSVFNLAGFLVIFRSIILKTKMCIIGVIQNRNKNTATILFKILLVIYGYQNKDSSIQSGTERMKDTPCLLHGNERGKNRCIKNNEKNKAFLSYK